jgi:hypothetical protein
MLNLRSLFSCSGFYAYFYYQVSAEYFVGS